MPPTRPRPFHGLVPIAGFLLTLLTLAARPACADSMADIFERVHNAVVVVHSSSRMVPEQSGGEVMTAEELGSGVLIGSEGRVLTAAHVVQVADSVTVQFPTGESVSAKVIASEPWEDVAILQVSGLPQGAVSARLGDSDKVRTGDQVMVIGAPLGMDHTLTVGHISGRRRVSIVHGSFASGEFLQTDAAINIGNSGGPMFNMDGEVIGIVSHIVSKTGTSAGLGFVASSKMIADLMGGQGAPWSGMEGHVLEGAMAKVFQLPEPRGILVERVAAGSPAERIGLREGTMQATIGGETFIVGGDVILEIQGIKPTDPASAAKIRETMGKMAPGEILHLVVLRDGHRIELTGALIPK